MNNKLILTMSIIFFLFGCTATNRYKGPNFTFDDLDHDTPITLRQPFKSQQPSDKPKEQSDKPEVITLTQACSQANSVHSPIIWLPIIGPGIDLLMVPSASELGWNDAWEIIPLLGPPITYVKGSQECAYFNLNIDPPDLDQNVSVAVINEAITISDKNCSNFQHILTAGMGELNANQKVLGDAATITQTGAAFANPVAGAIIGGLKQLVTSANDAIKTSFFVTYGAPQLFENIATIRHGLITELTTPENPNVSKWGFTSKQGMKYSDLRRFTEVYDKSCFFEQAVNDLGLTTDQGQSQLKSATPKAPSNIGAKSGTTSNNFMKDILINNNANNIQ